MSRGRRRLYMELNRPIMFWVHPPDLYVDDTLELYTGYFVLDIPDPDSEFSIWLIRDLNVIDKTVRTVKHWCEVSDFSINEIELDGSMSADEIALRLDEYQRLQYHGHFNENYGLDSQGRSLIDGEVDDDYDDEEQQ